MLYAVYRVEISHNHKHLVHVYAGVMVMSSGQEYTIKNHQENLQVKTFKPKKKNKSYRTFSKGKDQITI